MDLVPFYPRSLYLSSSAPLHFLVTLRSTYVSLTHDPFFVEPAHEPWFQAFMYIEALVQFPLAVYLVYNLLKQSKGAAMELAGVAFGCVTGMGSVTCCYVLAVTAEEVLSSEKRAMLFWGEYLPFAVIREFPYPGDEVLLTMLAIIMAFDMNQRLLSRIGAAESRAKKQ